MCLSEPYLREATGFEVYEAVSQQIREIFAEHTPIIEPLSLDEAYWALFGCLRTSVHRRPRHAIPSLLSDGIARPSPH